MDVPVENANSLTLRLGYLGSNGNIIKNAKSCQVIALGMMSRRSSDAVSSQIFVVKNALDTFNSAQSTQTCRLIALFT